MIDKIVDKLRGLNVAILGFAREGRSSFEFIKKYLPNQHVTIIDKEDFSEELKNENVTFITGDNYLDGLDKYDLVLKTPGISLLGVDCSSVVISSQIELLLEVHKERVIGVTGTKGKSTTTSLIYEILRQNGIDCVLTGNIGIPTFSLLEQVNENTYFVVEMSSHQLEMLDISPHIGIITNLFQDHLDHTGGVKEYYKAKMNMFKFQNENDYKIYYKDNKNLRDIIDKEDYKGQEYTVSTNELASIYLKDNNVYYDNRIVFNKDIKRNLLGDHNFINIMISFLVGKIFNIDDEQIIRVISDFRSLPYRLEYFATVDDVKYYVDTLATIPEATIEAIKSIPNVNTVIIGGLNRGISYDGFADALKRTNVKNIICMPSTGHEIAKDLPKDRVYIVDTLKEAAELAMRITERGTSCVLSPGAASYDYFKNYIEKGDKFKEYIINNR